MGAPEGRALPQASFRAHFHAATWTARHETRVEERNAEGGGQQGAATFKIRGHETGLLDDVVGAEEQG
jgi:hypothetical protein